VALCRFVCMDTTTRPTLTTAVLQCYDHALDAAFEEAREHDLTRLVQTVRRWRFEADARRGPDVQRSSWHELSAIRVKGRHRAKIA